MSLINEALKRAKAAQEQTPLPPVEHLPLRPVEPQVAVTHGIGLALPVAFATIALLLLFFAWRLYMDTGRGEPDFLPVAANTGQTASKGLPPVPATSVPTATPGVSAPEAAPKSAPVSTSAPTPAPSPSATLTLEPTNAAVPAQTATSSSIPKPDVAQTPNPAPGASLAAVTNETAVPKLPPLVLQGVVCSRTRPSAVINGKTVFVGDRVREFRVMAIGQDSATLVSNGQTNVLTLPD